MRNEIDIIRAIASGSANALAELYEMYADKVHNTALSYSKNFEDAEDITQDVFLKVHRSAAQFKGRSSVSTWIYRIAVNTSINHINSRKKSKSFENHSEQTDQIEFNHPGVILEQKENANILFKVIDCLPERQKTAFILSYVEFLPRLEVAEIMEISLKAVESLLQRAKSNMRSDLEKYKPNEGNS